MACVVTFSATGQIDSGFVAHLTKNNLSAELSHYLSSHTVAADTSAYYWMRYHYQFGSNSTLVSEAIRAKGLLRRDTGLLLQYSVTYLDPQQQLTKSWFESVLDSGMLVNESLRTVHLTYCLSQNPDPQATVPKVLEADYLNLVKAAKKKPYIAGTLSAIIPGLGLLYVNKPRACLNNLVFLGAMGVQTFESAKILGWKHPLTLVNSGFFTGFYLVNIIGSVLEVRKNYHEKSNQFLIHAARYYTDTYHLPIR